MMPSKIVGLELGKDGGGRVSVFKPYIEHSSIKD